MKIKSIILATTLALSTILPVGDTLAASGIVIPALSYVDGTTLHVEGGATSGALAASIEVYLDDTLIAGPENTNINNDNKFSYDMTGDFDGSKTYKVCTADFDGGTKHCQDTKKLIKTINLTVKPPKIGDTVTLVDQGGYDWPDKEVIVSSSINTYNITMNVWDKDGTGAEFFEGTFSANTNYYAFIDLTAKGGYVFSSNPTIKINGGGVLSDSEVWPGAGGIAVFVKIKANETGEIAEASTVTAGDTGTAPTATEDTSGIVKKNISLGVSAAISATILYGAHLIIKRKTTRKQ